MSDQDDLPGVTDTTPFPRLFSPLRLGPLEIRNRIFSSGHDTVMGEHGLIGDRLVAYQQARAAGGVGLIVVQVASVHASAEYTPHALSAMSDAVHPRVPSPRRGRPRGGRARSSARSSTVAGS